MLSLKDCLDMSEVSEAELAAIARHEHIPPILALELGQRLIQSAGGLEKLRQFILDDIMSAQHLGRCRDCEQFSRTLAEFNEKHPGYGETPLRRAEFLRELLAIGQVPELRQSQTGSDAQWTVALRELQEAKKRHDCCACRHLSLGLLRLLDSAAEPAETDRR